MFLSNELHIKERSWKGLGTNICFLSRILSSKTLVTIETSPLWYRFFSCFKSYFNIENLNLVENNYLPNNHYWYDRITDQEKFFCDYIKTPLKHNGKFIGFACNNHNSLGITSILDFNLEKKIIFPKNKEYSFEHYGILFSKFKSWGYDVITLDSISSWPLEEKIDFIHRNCYAIVGYEGGIAHLAHMLDIPYIMLPWHRDGNGNFLTESYVQSGIPGRFNNKITNLVQSMHLDRKTYFLDSFSEISSWDNKDFNEIMNRLNSNGGNNIFLDPEIDIFFNNELTYWGTEIDKIVFNSSEINHKESTKFFLDHYDVTDLKIGGVKKIKLG